MTEKKKEKLSWKIIESRTRLLRNNPFFALLLMHLRFVALEGKGTVSTNGRCVFFSADFLSKLYSDELDFILCHQVMHILNGDVWRESDLVGENFHHACDIVINSQLEECGFNKERYPHLGKVFSKSGLDGAPGKLFTAKESYDRLYYNVESMSDSDKKRFMFDSDEKWDKKKDVGRNGVVLLDADDFYAMDFAGKQIEVDEQERIEGEGGTSDGSLYTPTKKALLKLAWEMRMAQAESAMRKMMSEGKCAGTTPGFISRKIDRLGRSRLDWKQILNGFLREETTDYSFLPPDRRFCESEFFLPDYNEKDYVAKDVLFMVDTSGSVNRTEMTLAFTEIKGAIEQFGGQLNGKLGFFDYEVNGVTEFSSVKDVLKATPVGGGGTSFGAVFDYVRVNYKEALPACIVIFTDGCAEYPDEDCALGVPVLWLINNEDAKPPWGRVARVLLLN